MGGKETSYKPTGVEAKVTFSVVVDPEGSDEDWERFADWWSQTAQDDDCRLTDMSQEFTDGRAE